MTVSDSGVGPQVLYAQWNEIGPILCEVDHVCFFYVRGDHFGIPFLKFWIRRCNGNSRSFSL